MDSSTVLDMLSPSSPSLQHLNDTMHMYARLSSQNSVCDTPTVMLNGLIDPSVSR